MSWFSRFFRRGPDPRDAMRPLWHRIVEVAREPEWYAEHGVADTVAGRFDMITTVMCLVLIRMERDPVLKEQPALLTELFVEDMDGQLRESGVGDVVVGKHVGKLMSVLGGRLGAFRDALRNRDEAAMDAAVARNLTLIEDADPRSAGAALRKLDRDLAKSGSAELLAGEIPR